MKNSLRIFSVSVLVTWIGIIPISTGYWDNWFGPGTLEHANYLQQDGVSVIGIRQPSQLRQCLTAVNFAN